MRKPSLQSLMRRATTPLKLHLSRQTGNLVVVLGVGIGNDVVLSRRDLLRKFDVLGELGLAVVDGAVEVDVLDGVAEVGGLLDDGDQAVLDLQVDVGALVDLLGQVAFGGDGEGGAAEI